VPLVNPIVLRGSRQPFTVLPPRPFSLTYSLLSPSPSLFAADVGRRSAPADTWTKIYAGRDFATRGSLVPSAETGTGAVP